MRRREALRRAAVVVGAGMILRLRGVAGEIRRMLPVPKSRALYAMGAGERIPKAAELMAQVGRYAIVEVDWSAGTITLDWTEAE